MQDVYKRQEEEYFCRFFYACIKVWKDAVHRVW